MLTALVACGDNSATGGSTSSKEPPASARRAPANDPSAASAQLRNSILNFGREGSEAELEEAAVVVRDYLVARAQGDFSAACSYLSKYMLEVVTQFAKQQGTGGCVQGVKALAGPPAETNDRELTVVDASSLRRRKKRVFVIYTDGYGSTFAMLMRPEGNAWKIQEFEPTPLS